jgi:hypothetical protein
MGTTLSPWRHELGTNCRDGVADLATLHDFAPLSNIARIWGEPRSMGIRTGHGEVDEKAIRIIGSKDILPAAIAGKRRIFMRRSSVCG